MDIRPPTPPGPPTPSERPSSPVAPQTPRTGSVAPPSEPYGARRHVDEHPVLRRMPHSEDTLRPRQDMSVISVLPPRLADLRLHANTPFTFVSPSKVVANAMKAMKESPAAPTGRVVVGLRHVRPMDQDEGIHPSTTDSQLILSYRKDAGRQRWLDIGTNRRAVPAVQTVGPSASKVVLSLMASHAIAPLLKGMSTEAPSPASSSLGAHIVGPPRQTGLSEDQVRLIGVARWPDSTHNEEEGELNRQYGITFHAAVREAASRMAGGQIATFRQLWTFAADARHAWAETCHADDRKDFAPGPPRASQAMTPLNWRYEYLVQRLDSERRSGQRQMEIEDGCFDPIDFAFAAHHVFQARDTLDGQAIELTRLRIAVDPADFEDPYVMAVQKERPTPRAFPASIQHTDPSNIQPIVNHVESMFGDLVRTPRPPAQLLEALADIHWWMSHAMPDARGSAAKTEMAVRAIAAAHGIELPPFKRGIVPDMEAFAMDRASFRAAYEQMFGGPFSRTSPAEPGGSA